VPKEKARKLANVRAALADAVFALGSVDAGKREDPNKNNLYRLVILHNARSDTPSLVSASVYGLSDAKKKLRRAKALFEDSVAEADSGGGGGAPLPPLLAASVDEVRWSFGMQLLACDIGMGLLEVVKEERGVDSIRFENMRVGRLPAIQRIAPKTRQRLRSKLEALLDEHRRLWLQRNRPGGLEESAGRLKRTIDLLAYDT
jgi:hypothetical protein